MYVFCHIYAKIKIASYYYLFKKKHCYIYTYVIIHIKSVFKKNQNHYCYNTFLEKCFYELAKNNWKKN